MEKPDWNRGDSIRSIVEVSGLLLEAASLCVEKSVEFVVEVSESNSRLTGPTSH